MPPRSRPWSRNDANGARNERTTVCCVSRRSLPYRASGQRERKRRAGQRQVRRSVIGETDADVPNRARGLVVYLIGEHARQQSVMLLLRQRCKLEQAGVQPLQLAFRHRVEVHTTNPFLDTRTLQPTQKNLGSTRVCDRLLAQSAFDLCVRRGLVLKARCAGSADLSCAGVPGTRGVPPRQLPLLHATTRYELEASSSLTSASRGTDVRRVLACRKRPSRQFWQHQRPIRVRSNPGPRHCAQQSTISASRQASKKPAADPSACVHPARPDLVRCLDADALADRPVRQRLRDPLSEIALLGGGHRLGGERRARLRARLPGAGRGGTRRKPWRAPRRPRSRASSRARQHDRFSSSPPGSSSPRASRSARPPRSR